MSLLKINKYVTSITKKFRCFSVALLILGCIFGMEAAVAGPINQAARIAGAAIGGGGNAPWIQPLVSVQDSITGPTARAITAILVCVLGLGIGFGMGGDMLQKGMRVVLGISIAFSGYQWISPMFGIASGALIC